MRVMRDIFKVGTLMGFVGAMAEVGYMSLYSVFAGGSAKEVLSSVTYTFLSSDIAWGFWGVPLGLAIHMVLGMFMGVVVYSLYLLVSKRVNVFKKEGDSAISHKFTYIMCYSLTALFAVWAINFYMVLPVINSHFLQIVPPLLALPSKLSFGLFMGLMLSRMSRN